MDGQEPLLAPAPPPARGDNRVRCLQPKTVSLEQAGGLQRMTLRGHAAAVHKVLLTPGGIDVITGALRAFACNALPGMPLLALCL